MKFSDIECGKRLFLGEGRPIALGIGNDEIRGSAFMEGPVQMGTASEFTTPLGTLMIARETNSDNSKSPPRSLWVKGNSRFEGDSGTPYTLNVTGDVTIIGDTDQTGNITATGTVKAATLIGAHTGGSISGGVSGKSAGAKAFDIIHPSKKGYRLRHICIEGPESAVFFRGRVKNDKIILLPEYWKDLVDINSITVQLQPIGAHQDIIVKRWDAEKIELQSKPGIPINCFYHIFAERKDIENLIVEYKGDSVDDYPGDNTIYSINK